MKSTRGYAIRPDTPPDRRACAWCGRNIALFGKWFARQNPTKMHPHTANGKKATRDNPTCPGSMKPWAEHEQRRAESAAPSAEPQGEET